MPGQPLNLDLPSLSDTLAGIVSKLVTAIAVIQADLEPKILPSEINVNAALSMASSALTNVGSVQLVVGNVPTAAGSIYYNSGEIWVRDSTGAVRLTLNGAIDAASVGGISGLGGTTGSVTFDLPSQEFRFLAATSTPADLVADDLVLTGSAGTVRFGVTSSISGAKSLLVDSLPASGASYLAYNAAAGTMVDGAGVAIAHDIKSTFVQSKAVAVNTGYTSSGTTITPDLGGRPVFNGSNQWSVSCGLRVGDQPQSIKVGLHKTSTGTTTIVARRRNGNSQPAIQTFTSTTNGDSEPVFTITTPVTLGADEDLSVEVTSAANLDRLDKLVVFWTHP